ncbi:hypothetical protein Tco_1039954 [Tanacetum coccineum]
MDFHKLVLAGDLLSIGIRNCVVDRRSKTSDYLVIRFVGDQELKEYEVGTLAWRFKGLRCNQQFSRDIIVLFQDNELLEYMDVQTMMLREFGNIWGENDVHRDLVDLMYQVQFQGEVVYSTLLSMVSELFCIHEKNYRDVGWGEADSEPVAKKDSMKKAFQGLLQELGEVNPVLQCILKFGSKTSKDNEDPSWSKVSR